MGLLNFCKQSFIGCSSVENEPRKVTEAGPEASPHPTDGTQNNTNISWKIRLGHLLPWLVLPQNKKNKMTTQSNIIVV